jgi:hypothetical protein
MAPGSCLNFIEKDTDDTPARICHSGGDSKPARLSRSGRDLH